jgi:metal-responsive CopG/Arc/MetJ family transcriptional regulator
MEETVSSLPQETIAALETITKQTGRSRNELIQTAVQDFIQRNQPARPRSI